MNISIQTAQAIVQEITSAVHRPVNLMDNSGYIIASTDPARVGTRHGGAKRIVEEKLEYLAIQTDDLCNGVKTGVNMPLYFRNDIVGVIGVSGEWSQIKPYVDLIRKATEALLLDSYIRESTSVILLRQHEYMQTLLFENPSRLPAKFFEDGRILGIDIEEPHCCLCIALKDPAAGKNEKGAALLKDLEHTAILLKRGILCYRNKAQLYLFLPMTISTVASARVFLQDLASCTGIPEIMELTAGLDPTPRTGTDLRIGRQHAETALLSARSDTNCSVVSYDSLTSGLYLNEISRSSKKEYLHHVFPHMNQEEILEWVNILSVLYACNGSINRAADQLFVHKNTLQYHLKKLASQTGRDPRCLEHVGLYQTAILFYHSLEW